MIRSAPPAPLRRGFFLACIFESALRAENWCQCSWRVGGLGEAHGASSGRAREGTCNTRGMRTGVGAGGEPGKLTDRQ